MIPVIIFTGLEKMPHRVRGFRHGADDYVVEDGRARRAPHSHRLVFKRTKKYASLAGSPVVAEVSRLPRFRRPSRPSRPPRRRRVGQVRRTWRFLSPFRGFRSPTRRGSFSLTARTASFERSIKARSAQFISGTVPSFTRTPTAIEAMTRSTISLSGKTGGSISRTGIRGRNKQSRLRRVAFSSRRTVGWTRGT